ncbi:MAG: FUSC family protein, partial [Bacteroidota bacterium]
MPSSRLHLPPRPVLAHAARTTLAALLALWIAYALEINNPFSGAITVMIVAHPVHGLVLTKSLYRFAGTLVGAAMATLLMGLFAQTPEMFLLFLSLWMGVCTFGSTLLRNFQSYGTVLAGYTVALICLPGTEAPQMTFDLITSRVAVVSLGIACSGVVAALTTSGSAARGMRSSFKAALGALGAYIRLALAGSGEDLMAPARAKLSAQIAGLDAQVDFAAVEAAQVAPLRDALRAGLAAMLGCLTAATSLRDALGRAGDGLRDKTQEMETVLADIDAALACGESRTAAAALSAADDRLVAMMAALDTELSPDRLPLLVVQDRLSEVLDELRIAVNGMVGLLTGEIPATVANSGDSLRRLAFHLDWRGGLINGVRATIAV